jgi:hypothetical protein
MLGKGLASKSATASRPALGGMRNGQLPRAVSGHPAIAVPPTSMMTSAA